MLTDPDSFKHWTLGDIRVTRVLELAPAVYDPAILFPTTKEEVRAREWLCPDYATSEGDVFLHFQAFIIEAAGKRIMVDPCIGNDKPRKSARLNMLDTPFLSRLEAAGFPRESIDVVLCTHLHVDHCGWNTMLVDNKWVPTFPNARYLFAKDEVAFSLTDSRGDDQTTFVDSVQPIFDAGLADLIDPGHAIVEGVRLEPTPGHTRGHCSVWLSSKGEVAVITGDAIHHPLQLASPDMSSHFCRNSDLAARTRRTMLGAAAKEGALLLGSHFAGPTGVYVKSDGDGWRIDDDHG